WVKKMFLNLLFSVAFVAACTAQDKTTVVILGGGMSGVMAAKTLNDAGITDFIIVESQAELGGRMKRFDWIEGNATLELGAGWVHGTTGNPIWDFIKKFNISGSITDYEDYTARDANGQDVTAQLDAAYERLETAQNIENLLETYKSKNNGSDINKRVALRLGGWDARTTFEHAAEYFDYDFEYGVPSEHTSLIHGALSRNDKFSPDDYRIVDPRGYRFIVQATADEFLNPGAPQLRINERVIGINTSNKNGVQVTLESGATIHAEYAINTFSLGLLQSGNIIFKPSLTYKKLEAINSFKMSLYTKIFLKFPSQFWDETEFIVHTSKRKGYYTIWENLNHKKVLSGSNIIYATLTGTESQRVEMLSDNEIKSEAMVVLRSMYGDKIPDPTAILVSRWAYNSATLGSYSNWPIGFDEDNHAKLKEPVGHLFFGGEHTNGPHCGEVTGAYYAGVDVANEVIQCIASKC
ncbi:unnamed protein product, partial [Owenia fusiformis]